MLATAATLKGKRNRALGALLAAAGFGIAAYGLYKMHDPYGIDIFPFYLLQESDKPLMAMTAVPFGALIGGCENGDASHECLYRMP